MGRSPLYDHAYQAWPCDSGADGMRPRLCHLNLAGEREGPKKDWIDSVGPQLVVQLVGAAEFWFQRPKDLPLGSRTAWKRQDPLHQVEQKYFSQQTGQPGEENFKWRRKHGRWGLTIKQGSDRLVWKAIGTRWSALVINQTGLKWGHPKVLVHKEGSTGHYYRAKPFWEISMIGSLSKYLHTIASSMGSKQEDLKVCFFVSEQWVCMQICLDTGNKQSGSLWVTGQANVVSWGKQVIWEF